MTTKLTRRELIKLLGGGGVLVFADGCTRGRRGIQDYLDQFTEKTIAMERLTGERSKEVPWSNRIEEWKNTTCMMCDSRCGLVARIIDANLVFIKGNREHPVNYGGICPLGIAGLQYQYSPDRIISPLLRKGERGSMNWEKIGLRKAMDVLDEVLLKVKNTADSVVFITDEQDTAREVVIKYFLKALRSNLIVTSAYNKSQRLTIKKIFNVDSVPIYDIENSDYILSFGADFLSYADNFMHYQRSYSAFRSRRGEKVRHVQIESRLSLTGGKSDLWIPIKPGKEALLAIGIAYIIIRERLYNESFVNNFLDGFEYFITEVLKNTDLEYIGRETGVDVQSIVRIAKELSNSKMPICIAGPQLYFSENAEQKISSVVLLNLLLGRFETMGGMLIEKNELKSEIETRIFGEGALNLKKVSWEDISNRPDIFKDKVVFITENNPFKFFSTNDQIIEAIKKARFICYWGQYPDEVLTFADLVVPDKSFLERNDISLASPGFRVPVVSVVNALVNPGYETLDLSEFLFDKCQRFSNLKGIKDYNEFLRRIKGEIFLLRKGEVFTSDKRRSIVDILETQGFWYSPFKDPSEFIAELDKVGCWWNPYYNYEAFGEKIRTKNGRVDLRAIYENITKELNKGEEKDRNFPLYLIPILSSYTGIEGRGSNIPWIYEIAGMRVNEKWTLWAEINPLTGRELGLEDGSKVRIVSPSGAVIAKVKFFEGAYPGCVNVLFGAGADNFGSWAKEFNGSLHPLFSKDALYNNGSPVLFFTKVRIERV